MLIDLKSTDMYLKTLTQIANVYKMDGNKLLFSTYQLQQSQLLTQGQGLNGGGGGGKDISM